MYSRFLALRKPVIVDPDEVGLVLVGEGDAGGAVGLVADDQIELAEPLVLRRPR